MLRTFLFAFLGFVVLTCSAWAADTGFIQVKCLPGVQIFLNGKLKGITSADVGGLIMQDVPVGRHDIRAFMPGFLPQADSITVGPGQVVAFTVKAFVPKIEVTQTGKEQDTAVKLKLGLLQIQSVPIKCRLTIARLGINNQTKTKDQWTARGVPVGKYTVEAEALGKRLTYMVEVWENGTAELLFNFVNGEVKNLGSVQREKDEAAAKARAKELEAIHAEARKQGLEFPKGWAFVPIKPGKFTMGSPPDETGRDKDENHREVTLTRPFWMSAYETTQAQYEDLMGRNPSRFKGAQRPVDSVSWDDAQDFLRKLNERERKAGRLPKNWAYRLPTEAEWEYACRAGSNTAYCYGNGSDPLEDYAWYSANSEETRSVGHKRPSAWGLYDMHGNVWEWCADWYGPYGKAAETDPMGPATGKSRVLRGGSWYYSSLFCRSADRRWNTPRSRNPNYGFRVAVSAGVD